MSALKAPKDDKVIKRKKRRNWSLVPIALAAFVGIWSGWVSLGEMCGFGEVKPLPGISEWSINTAMTLPLGVEAYAAVALNAWLSTDRATSKRTRRFAKWSAMFAMVLGMLGQIAYHLLKASGETTAPTPIIVFVSCLPVVVLGLAAALKHMLAEGVEDTAKDAKDTIHEVSVEDTSSMTHSVSPARTEVSSKAASAPAPERLPVAAESVFEDTSAASVEDTPQVSSEASPEVSFAPDPSVFEDTHGASFEDTSERLPEPTEDTRKDTPKRPAPRAAKTTIQPPTREKALDLLRADPDMNAADLARALGKEPSGYVRKMRADILAELGIEDTPERHLTSVSSVA